MGDFRFLYDLQQHGWAEVTLESGSRLETMRVSYMSDALRDLLDAAWGLTQGATQTTAVLQREPTEWGWTFRRSGDDVSIEVRLLESRSLDGPIVVEGTTTLTDLAGQFVGEAGRILREYGAEGYRQRWVADPFPSESYARLSEWMADAS